MFRFLLGLIIFIISITGYGIFLKNKKITIEFIPIILFSSFISILFISGLLNILKLSIYVLTLVGLILFLLEQLKIMDKFSFLKIIRSPGMLFFLCSSILFGVLNHDTVLLHYDNFSHWGLIVKSLVLTGELPSFKTEVISFASYPPGSALFVYYFIKVIGTTEANALLGQAVLCFSCITTLFAWLRKFFQVNDPNKVKKIRSILLLVVTFSIYLLNGPNTLKDLLVDNLLLLFAMATMNIILFYFDHFKKALILSLPLMISMLLIKNSGVIFVGINTLLLLASLWKYRKENKQTKRDAIKILGIFLTPWFLFYLWQRHVVYLFKNGGASKHAMSIGHYKKVFSEKTFADIVQITKAFIFRMFNYKEFPLFFELVLFSLLLFVVLIYIKKYEHIKIKMWRNAIVGINLIFIGYMTILWSMYLLSMPLSEARYLASYDRYAGGIFNFLIAALVVLVIVILTKVHHARTVYITCLGLSLVFMFMIVNKLSDYGQSILSDKVISVKWEASQKKISQAFPSYKKNILLEKDTQHQYIVYMPSSKNDGYYAYYYIAYRVFNSKVKIISDEANIQKITGYLTPNDYLVVVDKDSQIKDYIKEKHLVYETNGLYKLK